MPGATETSTKRLRRAGLKRIGPLLEQIRAYDELHEARPASFQHGTTPFLHFHYLPDGTVRADVRLSRRGFTRLDVSDEVGQSELLAMIDAYLAR